MDSLFVYLETLDCKMCCCLVNRCIIFYVRHQCWKSGFCLFMHKAMLPFYKAVQKTGDYD